MIIKCSRLVTAVAAGLIGFAFADASQAQPKLATISIGRITSQKSCTVYQESSGKSAAIATPFMVATAESWRTWLVHDCVDNFASIRTSLQAALASTGKFAVKPQGASYSLSGAISQVGGDPDAAPASAPAGANFSISSKQIFVSMEVTLRDTSGRIVYGGLLTKHLETGSSIQTQNLQTASNQSGEALYTELQNQVALAVARLAAFHIVPLKVTSNDGSQIRLNYGSPLLTLGTIVHVTTLNGATARFNVVSADSSGAVAEADVGSDTAGAAPGSAASVIEADDPAANERRLKRVELP